MKKTICVLLSVILLLGVFSAALSASAEETPANSGYVAVMYLCVSGPHYPYFFGHAWLVIQNISDHDITVGPITLVPDQMLSAGTHFSGFAFNKELKEYRGSNVDAVKTYLTEEKLETAARTITDPTWKSFNLFTKNCTNFVSDVWYAVTGRRFRTFVFPVALRNQFGSNEKVKVYIA
ncbi:MAG: hypothetical protein IJS90_01415 [Clostridia bacterium]|nr:hypothetical protein [Clostridia bacterium]